MPHRCGAYLRARVLHLSVLACGVWVSVVDLSWIVVIYGSGRSVYLSESSSEELVPEREARRLIYEGEASNQDVHEMRRLGGFH